MSYVWIVECGCWLWTGSVTRNGYGNFRKRGQSGAVAAHRWSYEQFMGVIPQGLQVDHACHIRSCVNPDHLRVATSSQNNANRRGASPNSRSGVRGVYKHALAEKWVAQVKCRGERYYLGLFDTPTAAAAAVQEKRLSLFGEFAGNP